MTGSREEKQVPGLWEWGGGETDNGVPRGKASPCPCPRPGCVMACRGLGELALLIGRLSRGPTGRRWGEPPVSSAAREAGADPRRGGSEPSPGCWGPRP